MLSSDPFAGDTFTDGSVKYTMTSMNVPEPVMSLAVSPVSKDSGGQVSGHTRTISVGSISWALSVIVLFSYNCSLFGRQFSKALNRFQKEDPTFRVGLDAESGEVICLRQIGASYFECYVNY